MNMKRLMVAIALTSALAAPVGAEPPVAFRAKTSVSDTNVGGAFPVFQQVVSGDGEGTHFGRFSVHFEWQVNVVTLNGVGTFTLTWADGSTLFGTATATSIVVDGMAYIAETCVITGGTGRFEEATGVIVGGRVLTIATNLSSASYEGTIQLP